MRAKKLTPSPSPSSSRSSSRASLCRASLEFSDLESDVIDKDHGPPPSDDTVSIHSSIEKNRRLGKLYICIVVICDVNYL